MARKLRIQYPGAIYHVMNRGDHQELIFGDDEDRRQFVSTLAECCQKAAWQVHSFCLMWDQPDAGGQFGVAMEARRWAEREQEFNPVERGWCGGSEEFRAEMLRYIEAQRGQWHYGAELSESGEAKAERLIAEALRTDGVTEGQIAGWRKGHPFKVQLAARLRAQTTVTVSWIAQRLRMGTRGHLAHLLYRNEQTDTFTKCVLP